MFIAINQIDDPLVDASIAQDLLYWLVRISVMVVGLWTADILVGKLLANRWNTQAWLKPVVVVSALGLLPFALAEILVEPYLPMRPEYVDDDLWAVSPLLAYLSEYATVVTIVIPVHLLLWLVLERGLPIDSSVVETAESSQPEFLTQSAVRDVNEIYALQAEEHYVRIYAATGTELVHFRFGDAVSQMPSELGLQVHRSWWVAESAILSASRGDRRWQLKLADDLAVPVSDSYVKAVRERGWLKRKPRKR